MRTKYRLPKRITPQQDADERIVAMLLKAAIERDSRLTQQEQEARQS